MKRLLLPLILLALGGALFAGCGSKSKKSDSGSAASTPAAAPASTGGKAAPAAGGGVTVDMQNIQFAPKAITAKVGQTIKWTNKDSVDHNVTATKGESFKSKNFGAGGGFSYKVDKPGTISYVCTLHPGMEGTITVTA